MNGLRKRILNMALTLAIALTLCAVHASAAETKLPILMYHHLTTDHTETNSMTVTADRFRQDMEFLKEYGFTPLLSADLVNIRSGAQLMPEKPVMITFDDGYESNYLLAYPIIKETGMKATISLITSHMRENEAEGYLGSLTWAQVKELYSSGIIDIGCHTHALHNEENQGMQYDCAPNGIQRKPNEAYTAYMSRVQTDLSAGVALIKSHIGQDKSVWYFSYPFGATDSWFGQALLDNRFYVSTTTLPQTADIGKGLYGLPRYRITEDLPVSRLLQHSATAQPSMMPISLNGQPTSLPTYKIEGSNFVKLRDIAALLENSIKKFSVSWQDDDIQLTPGAAYVRDGSEFKPFGTASKIGKSMVGQVHIYEKAMMLAAYSVDGNYFFNLRSLGEKLGFTVAYDEINQIVIIETM